jgi:hypothetical protein
MKGIANSIAKYIKMEEPTYKFPDEETQLNNDAKETIKNDTGVYFNFSNGFRQYLGKQNNIKEAQEVLKDII